MVDAISRVGTLTAALTEKEGELANEEDRLLNMPQDEKNKGFLGAIHTQINKLKTQIGLLKAFIETWKDIMKFTIDIVKMFNNLLQ